MNSSEHPSTVRPRGGFTLLELLVVTTVTALLMVSLLSVFASTGNAFTEMSAEADADAMVLRSLTRIEDELRYAIVDTVAVPVPFAVTFSTSAGWDGEDSIPSTPQWLFLDSGKLMLGTVVLMEGVTGFAATLDEELLTVSLQVGVASERNGQTETITRSFVSQFRLGS